MTYRRIFGPLLFAYPRDFRQHYREQLFVDLDEATAEGAAGGPSFLLRTAVDIIVSGLWMRLETPARDLAFSLRALARTPLFTIVAILTLALAIGVNGAVFAVVNAVLLKPLPFVQPQGLAFVSAAENISFPIPPPLLGEYGRSTRFFELAAYRDTEPTLTGYGRATSLMGESVSSNLFGVMNVRPQLGRFFIDADARPGTHSLVLSDAFWRTRLNGDPHVVGRILQLDRVGWTVIGVAPPHFAMADFRTEFAFGSGIAVFECTPASTFGAGSQAAGYWGLLRLRPGFSLAAARAELRRVDAGYERRNPQERGIGVLITPLQQAYLGDVRPLLYAALCAVLLVLLIACANLANLLLVRGATREREFAVRAALGAQRSRLAAHILTEAGLLSLGGGLVGALFAWLLLGVLVGLSLTAVPRIASAQLDLRVVGFLFAAVVFATLVAGMMPVLTLGSRNLTRALAASGRGGDTATRNGLRSALIVVEIGLAFAVLAASMLLVRSAVAVASTSLGFAPQDVSSASIFLETSDSSVTPRNVAARARSFVAQTLARVGAEPAVAADGVALTVPGTNGAIDDQDYRIAGHPSPGGPLPSVTFNRVTPGYFSTLRIPLNRGRLLNADDRFGARPVVVLSAGFARRAFGAGDPIGKAIRFPDVDAARLFTVVGVVGDTRLDPQERSPRPLAYVSFDQYPAPVFQVLLRAKPGAGAALPGAAITAIAGIDRLQAVGSFRSLSALIIGDEAPQRTDAFLLGILALVALLLAVAGIYGVSAYSVSQRTHEFGVRLAIGAKAGDILRIVLARALSLGALGIALGLILAGLGTRFLSDLLFEISTFDAISFAAVIAILLASVTLASLVPALRATRTDPVVALRYE